MTERTQLQPVEGLARSTKIMAPPSRKTRPVKTEVVAPAPEVTKPRPQPSQAPTRPAPTAGGGFKRMTLSMPVVVAEGLRDRAVRDAVPQVDVLMDALDATKDRLEELLAGGERQQRSGLFVRSTPRASEPLTTLSLRVLADNAQVIDQLVDQLEAASRSRLCTVALRDYLGLPE